MKKAGRILSLVLVLVMIMTAFCYAATPGAGTFELKNTYPEDGSKGASVENLGVKLYFDTTFTESVLKDTNDKAFQLLDAEGKSLPVRVLYAPKEEGVVLVLLDTNHKDADGYIVQGNQDYTLKITSGLQDDNGNTFGQNKDIVFKTMNTQRNMVVNMLLMFVMMGGMMFFTMKSTQKQVKEMQSQKEEKMNPYKEAKRTGKSVEEVLEQYEKEKEKNAQKAARKAKKDDDYYFEFDVNYRVKAPRPISEGGSTYKTGRKALAEAKKAEAAAKKAQKAAYEAKAKKKKKH